MIFSKKNKKRFSQKKKFKNDLQQKKFKNDFRQIFFLFKNDFTVNLFQGHFDFEGQFLCDSRSQGHFRFEG